MLERIRALRSEGRFDVINEMVPYARFLGLECAATEDGPVTVLRYREQNIGNTQLPALHGGTVSALLEHAAVMQLLWEVDPVLRPKPINLSVDFLRPAGPRDTFAAGRIYKQGQRVANVRVEAWQESRERPIAAAYAHFLVAWPRRD